ncbi:MAG: cobyric acid synthase [Caldimicrobium sp.]
MSKALTIVGTNSSAGKSFLVSALGRYFVNKGFKVAPFKAQNMSLQSFVCRDGGEIGLAQALQALACKLEPESIFNPILLKPEGRRKSQVLLRGKYYKTLTAEDYYKEKENLWSHLKEILDDLNNRYDILLLEGAGSPAEINLLEADLVNIKPAIYLQSPVIIVGDIDKGGVFASLYGTVELLKKFCPDYAELIKGFIINKFRGALKILKPGIKKLHKLTGLPTLGVLPYLSDFHLSEEDGFSFFSKASIYKRLSRECIKIVVLALKHISNFSDFDPFYLEEEVELLYSLRKEDILSADIIIIPGSKNTFSDLKLLHQMEISKTLKEAKNRGAEIIGICGGFQMLGKILKNPYKLEAPIKEMKGLGLLEVETFFYPEKITSQVYAEPLATSMENLNLPLWGYEIHKGVTYGDLNLFKIKRLASGEILIDGKKEGNVWGTYLHGLFTNDQFRGHLLNNHRQKKDLPTITNPPSYWNTIDKSFNILANFIETSLNMKKIYKLLKIDT